MSMEQTKKDKNSHLPQELWESRQLVWKLAKNDFKNRYAGSYLGRIWAFVQPVITIVLYWFVFDYIMKAKAQFLSEGLKDVPYVMWLTAGLVPWFFFSEAIMGGTNSLFEYSYLVKKVVFKFSVIPVIKLITSTFTHAFFVLFMLILYFCMGFAPSVYLFQLLYYSICLFAFVLALSYATSALVVFFRDLLQIINIGLQVGMWVTPILWNIGTIHNEVVIFILKLNPMYYIVNGYRDCLFEKVWFFEHGFLTIYFWVLTILLYLFGTHLFKKLKVHFADVM